MAAPSVISWIARVADRLQVAGFNSSEVVIAISKYQEDVLREEFLAMNSVYIQSFHHTEFMGWRVIVKGEK